jgi:hypothetical protein
LLEGSHAAVQSISQAVDILRGKSGTDTPAKKQAAS